MDSPISHPSTLNPQPSTIAVIGLGYVGLPLAVAFTEKYKVVGIDINAKRIQELQSGSDTTLEVEDAELQAALNRGFVLSTDINDAADCNVFIVTVPTPTDKHNRPVLTPMVKASEAIAQLLKHKNTLNPAPYTLHSTPYTIIY